jgi:hypothetical protein
MSLRQTYVDILDGCSPVFTDLDAFTSFPLPGPVYFTNMYTLFVLVVLSLSHVRGGMSHSLEDTLYEVEKHFYTPGLDGGVWAGSFSFELS